MTDRTVYPFGFTCQPARLYHVWPGERDTCQCGERDRTVQAGGPVESNEPEEA